MVTGKANSSIGKRGRRADDGEGPARPRGRTQLRKSYILLWRYDQIASPPLFKSESHHSPTANQSPRRAGTGYSVFIHANAVIRGGSLRLLPLSHHDRPRRHGEHHRFASKQRRSHEPENVSTHQFRAATPGSQPGSS